MGKSVPCKVAFAYDKNSLSLYWITTPMHTGTKVNYLYKCSDVWWQYSFSTHSNARTSLYDSHLYFFPDTPVYACKTWRLPAKHPTNFLGTFAHDNSRWVLYAGERDLYLEPSAEQPRDCQTGESCIWEAFLQLKLNISIISCVPAIVHLSWCICSKLFFFKKTMYFLMRHFKVM